MHITLVTVYMQFCILDEMFDLFLNQSQVSQLRPCNFKLISKITDLLFFVFLELLEFVTLSRHVFH